MPDTALTQLRIADLSNRKPTKFDLSPDADTCKSLATQLGILAVKKARLQGVLTPRGASDWVLSAKLGATVVQACAITLDPVSTRIDDDVNRHFLADYDDTAGADAGAEDEMPEDDTVEPLPQTVDLMALLQEELSLALPAYPRTTGATLGQAVYTAPGTKPMTDDDAKPFAGLGALRDQLAKDD